MKETRIPYSLPMARARRAGLKTMTRRVAKLTHAAHVKEPGGHRRWHPGDPDAIQACPYGQPGDILLPVEPWRAPAEWDYHSPSVIPPGTPIWLDANGPAPEGFGRYRHARFMPRHLITARDEVVSVRVERLQDITEADAIAEGVRNSYHLQGGRSARENFEHLWWTINGDGSWEANPYVWVVEFKVVVP